MSQPHENEIEEYLKALRAQNPETADLLEYHLKGAKGHPGYFALELCRLGFEYEEHPDLPKLTPEQQGMLFIMKAGLYEALAMLIPNFTAVMTAEVRSWVDSTIWLALNIGLVEGGNHERRGDGVAGEQDKTTREG